ncbi:MAG: hypothetical protein LH650_02435 [Chloroflexi bacterium]|nr:hypothetical protein [Chloroflexota bacterium]
MSDAAPVPVDVLAAAAALAQARPMRRGSLTTRLMRCGQRTCACHTDPTARHGPYTEWSRVVRGRRESRYLDPGQAGVVRAQIAAGLDFRRSVEGLWEAAERWADAELSTEASQETAEKGGSASSSGRRSRPRSPR